MEFKKISHVDELNLNKHQKQPKSIIIDLNEDDIHDSPNPLNQETSQPNQKKNVVESNIIEKDTQNERPDLSKSCKNKKASKHRTRKPLPFENITNLPEVEEIDLTSDTLEPDDSTQEFESLLSTSNRINRENIAVGDVVQMSSDQPNTIFIGLILELRDQQRTRPFDTTIIVQWFYRPSEIPKDQLETIPGGPLQNEIFFSSYKNRNSISSVISKCRIVSANDYLNIDKSIESIYVCRYQYIPFSKLEPFQDLKAIRDETGCFKILFQAMNSSFNTQKHKNILPERSGKLNYSGSTKENCKNGGSSTQARINDFQPSQGPVDASSNVLLTSGIQSNTQDGSRSMKVGDVIEISTPNSSILPFMIGIILDSNCETSEPSITVQCFFQPPEIASRQLEKIVDGYLPNEIFFTPCKRTCPVSSVVGFCDIVSEEDYDVLVSSGKSQFTPGRNAFVCRYLFLENETSNPFKHVAELEKLLKNPSEVLPAQSDPSDESKDSEFTPTMENVSSSHSNLLNHDLASKANSRSGKHGSFFENHSIGTRKSKRKRRKTREVTSDFSDNESCFSLGSNKKSTSWCCFENAHDPIKVGSIVELANSKSEIPFVGRIVDMKPPSIQQPDECRVVVQWFYTQSEVPSDVLKKIPGGALPNEVFLSSYKNVNPVTSILNVCYMLNGDKYFDLLDKSGFNDCSRPVYTCRYYFYPLTTMRNPFRVIAPRHAIFESLNKTTRAIKDELSNIERRNAVKFQEKDKYLSPKPSKCSMDTPKRETTENNDFNQPSMKHINEKDCKMKGSTLRKDEEACFLDSAVDEFLSQARSMQLSVGYIVKISSQNSFSRCMVQRHHPDGTIRVQLLDGTIRDSVNRNQLVGTLSHDASLEILYKSGFNISQALVRCSQTIEDSQIDERRRLITRILKISAKPENSNSKSDL